jgi:DNA-binding NarL/FixJ family response regulator
MTLMRVVVAEDAPLLREGIIQVLTHAGLEVVAQASDADDLLSKVRAHRPDVAVVDIRMPPTNTDDGLRAALTLRAEHPDLGVLVLSQYVEDTYAQELLRAGAEGIGYLLKDRVGDIERFVEAVLRVGERGTVLDPEIVALLVGRHVGTNPLAGLSERERAVLALMAEGRSNLAIAKSLHLSEGSIEKHIRAIFTKLDLYADPDSHRRVLAVLAYLRA